MPKISVIMAVYNTENFLQEAVESILSQDFIDFEFIIIDDASSD
jgi:glycosyltransferase involved in cell wall biosynthesis